MPRPGGIRKFLRKATDCSLMGTLYTSRSIGLFPGIFDSGTKKFLCSKCLLVYGLIANAAVLWIYLKLDPDDEIEVEKMNPLVRQIDYLVEIMAFASSIVTHIRSFWNGYELIDILNEMILLKTQLVCKYCQQFDKYVITKGVLVVLEIVSSLVIDMGISWNSSIPFNVSKAVCGYFIKLGILMAVMQFYLAVVHIYLLVWNINETLLRTVSQLKNGNPVHPEKLQSLLRIYSRILAVNNQVTSLYDIQIISFMVTLISANIILAYVLIIFWINIRSESLAFMIAVFPQALCVNVCDLWATISVCDLAEREARRSSCILKHFTDFSNLDPELERTISEFTMFCRPGRLRYSSCHLFSINYAMGFNIMISNILYVLFLVQFDYMNLKYK